MIALLGGGRAAASPLPHGGEGRGEGVRTRSTSAAALAPPLSRCGEREPAVRAARASRNSAPSRCSSPRSAAKAAACSPTGSSARRSGSASRCSRRRSPASRSAPARPPTTSRSCRWRARARQPRPVLALAPGVGDVDMMVASELMEAGRAVAAGFVTPDRTLTIASTSRFYVMGEKIAMGDGRYDSGRLAKAIEDNSQGAHPDRHGGDRAQRTGAFINSVMLGVIAGSGRLPIPAEAFEAAIRADGKGVDGNLRGFRAGLDAARRQAVSGVAATPANRCRAPDSRLRGIERRESRRFAGRRRATSSPKACAGSPTIRTTPMRGSISTGSRRSAMPTRAPSAGGRLLRETARHLARAHVVRGRDPRRAGQDRSGAPRAHRRRGRRQAGRAGQDRRIPQARHRGILLGAAAVARAPHSRLAPSGAAGSRASIGAWRSTPPRSPAICASGCWRSCAACARARIATPRSSAQIERWLGADRRGRRAVDRARARSRRMRAPDQGLWRHPQARHRQLSR